MDQKEASSIVCLGSSLNRKNRSLWRAIENNIFEDDPFHILATAPKGKKGGDREFFILYSDGEAVGRAAVTVDKTWSSDENDKTGFIDDFVIRPSHKPLADMLIDHCLSVLKEKEATEVVTRSHGFPALAAQEFKDYPPGNLPSNPPWLIDLFEQKGFVKHKEWANFRFVLPQEASEAALARWETLLTSRRGELRPLNTKNRQEVRQYSDLTYKVLIDHYGYTPMRFMESRSLVKLPLFHLLCRVARFRIYVLHNELEEMVGFFSYHPDYNMSRGMLSKYTRLKWYNPRSLLVVPSFIRSIRTSKRAEIGAIGLAVEARRKGFIRAVDYALQLVREEGYEQLDTGPVLIENTVVVKMAKRFRDSYGVDMEHMTYYTMLYRF